MSRTNPADFLERAAEIIALDNGAVNRLTTRDEVVTKMIKAVKQHHSIEDRANVEEFLCTLTASELENLCAGEEGEVGAPPEVEAILNTMSSAAYLSTSTTCKENLMAQYTLAHPTDKRRNAVIRLDDDDVKAMIRDLGRCRLVLYEATQAEIDNVDAQEQDMESHEPDIGYFYPEDKDKVLTLIHNWTHPLSITDILHIVSGECRNSCTDSRSAYEFITETYSERVADRRHLHAILDILNFAAIRENASLIYEMT